MNPEEIYQRLWSTDDQFAQSIVGDTSLIPCLRVWALLKIGKRRRAKTLFDTQCRTSSDPFEEMLYQELCLFYNFGHVKSSDLKKQALLIAENFPLSVFARLTLANFEKDYAKAIELYATVLKIAPSNLTAITGFVKAHIILRNKQVAISVLKDIKKEKILARMYPRKRMYWNIVFIAYEIAAGKITGLQLTLGMSAFLLGLFPQTWVFPLAIFIAGILVSLYFITKDELVTTISLGFSLLIILTWLIGLCSKSLFFRLEGY